MTLNVDKQALVAILRDISVAASGFCLALHDGGKAKVLK